MVRKAKRGPKRASKRGVVKSSSKGKGVKKYLAENWASILLLVVIIVLLIVGIVYSQKSCRRNRMENFDGSSTKPALVMFHAPWCGHCKRAMPEFEKIKHSLKNKSGVKVDAIAINADEETELAQKHGIKGYPTIKYYPKGLDGGNPIDHTGERTVAGFKGFCSKQ